MPATLGLMSIVSINDLTCGQWALLGVVVRRCPVALRKIGRRTDLYRLIEAGLVSVNHARVCATRSGMEALWYHHLH